MLKKTPVLLPTRASDSFALEQNHYYYRQSANGQANLAHDLRATLSLLGSHSKPANEAAQTTKDKEGRISFIRVPKKQEPQKKCLLSVIKGQLSESPERVFSSIHLKQFDVDIKPEKDVRRSNPYSSSTTLLSGYNEYQGLMR